MEHADARPQEADAGFTRICRAQGSRQAGEPEAALGVAEAVLHAGQGMHAGAQAAGQLLYCCHGAALVEAGGWVWHASPHTAVWLPPGDYALTATRDAKVRMLAVPVQFDLPAGVLTPQASPLLAAVIDKLLSLLARGLPVRREMVEILVAELDPCAQGQLGYPLPGSEMLRDLCAYVEAHLAEDLHLPVFARRHRRTARTLYSAFSRECGVSLAGWISQRRLLEAVVAMEGGAAVGDVARAVGYRDSSAFCAMFRKKLGLSPRAYLHGRFPG